MRIRSVLVSFITLSVIFLTGLIFAPKTFAQTCMGTRVVNQYACVSTPAACTGYAQRCSFSGTSCDALNVCGIGQGSCIVMCDSYAPQGPPYCSSTGSSTVGCTPAPDCQYRGTLVTCSGGGGSSTSCTENTQTLTYGCWVNTGGSGGGGGGGGGYGACGGCSGCPGTNQTQCRTDPGGACVWDPSGCGQGSNNPPPAYVSQYFVTNYANAYPSQAISVTTQNTPIYAVAYPVNTTCNSKVVFSVLAGTATFPGVSGNVALSYWYYNPTAPQFWGVTIKPTSPGILVVRATAYTTCPGYEMVWSITDASILVNPPPQPPAQCVTPNPQTPTGSVCAPSAGTVATTWTWPSVFGADGYYVRILNSANADAIPNAGLRTAASVGCSPSGTCSITAALPAGTYHSEVVAHSSAGLCTPDSSVGRSLDYVLPGCSTTVTTTIEEDPSLTGGTAPTQTGSGSTAQCTSPSSGAAYSQGGAIKAHSTATGNDFFGTVTGSTATISNVPTATNDYTLTFSPLNNYYCTCPAGCVYNTKTVPLSPALKFYVSPVAENWYQTIGGEIAALGTTGTTVNNPIPATFCAINGCSPYFSLPLQSGVPETAGSLLISSGASADLKSIPSQQSDNVGNPSHLISTPTIPTLKESYDYFYRLYSMGVAPSNVDFTTGAQTQADAKKPGAPPDQGRAAYYSNGNLTVNTDWNVGGGQSIVVFVNGNLTINKEIKVVKGGFVAFFVKGNILITKDVGTSTTPFATQTTGQVQGVYFADGTLTVESVAGPTAEKKFVGEGTFVGKQGIILPRDFRYGNNGIENNAGPASLFIYRPDFLLNAPEKMKAPYFVWKEVAP